MLSIDTLITIIIPLFNNELTIDETLRSVINQTHTNWECILVDINSTDNTAKIVNQFKELENKFKYILREEGINGPSASRNVGINRAKGTYVIFLDADDVLDKDCLKNRLQFANNNPTYDFWVFKMQEFKTEIGDLDYVHNTYPENELPNEYLKLFLQGINAFSVTSPMWRTIVIKNLNGFNESLKLWEDPELHIRALLKGFRLKSDKEASPDCFYRNDRERKNTLRKSPAFLKKLFKNSWLYFNSIAFQIKGAESTYKLLLSYNVVSFIRTYCIDKVRFIPFIKFYLLLVRHRLVSVREGVILLTWFLFALFQIDKLGKYSQNSLRKRLYSLILKP